MADLFLTWEEAQGERLPHYCVSCAEPATEWADWRICRSRQRIFSIEYTHIDVTLPVCPRHRNLHWFFLQRVVARQIHEDGVLLSHVSPGFVEAVWDYRDEIEGRPAPASSGRFGPSTTSPDTAFAEIDDDDYQPKPLAGRRYDQDRYVQRWPGWFAAKIVFAVLAALFFAPFVLLMMCGLLGLILSLVIG